MLHVPQRFQSASSGIGGAALKSPIQVARERLGYSRDELAAKVGVTRQAVDYMERAWPQKSIRALYRYADAMRCRVTITIVPFEEV